MADYDLVIRGGTVVTAADMVLIGWRQIAGRISTRRHRCSTPCCNAPSPAQSAR